MSEKRTKSATQLQFDFSSPTLVHLMAIPQYSNWRDVTDIAKSAGFLGKCQVSTDLYEQLDDQALYNVLWTAGFTFSVNENAVAKFTLELDGIELIDHLIIGHGEKWVSMKQRGLGFA